MQVEKKFYKNGLIFCLSVLCLILSSCVPNPIKKYPEFKKEKLLIDSLSVLVDFNIITRTFLDGYYQVPYSDLEELGIKLSERVSGLFSEKQYTVYKVHKPSQTIIERSGMKLASCKKIPDFDREPSYSYSVNDRSLRKKKYKDKRRFLYLNPKAEKTVLNSIFPNASEPIDSSIKSLDFDKINALVIVSVRGLDDAIRYEGKVVLPGESSLELKLTLIDMRTRKVLWVDKRINNAVPSEINQIQYLLDSMFEYFPPKMDMVTP